MQITSLLQTIAVGILVAPLMLQDAHASDVRPLPDNHGLRAVDNAAGYTTHRYDVISAPMDQGQSDADLAISRQIRKAIAYRNALSTSASNVKIITRDGAVTLVGSVRTADERESMAVISAASAGVKRIDNQLEIDDR